MNIWEDRTDWGLLRRNEDLILEELNRIKPKSILEVGCGNGNWAPILSKYGSYLGTDISEKSIEICKKNFPDLNFKVLDVRDVYEGYDLIFGYTVLQLIPDLAVLKGFKKSKFGLFVEPTNFTSNRYCYCHDYEKEFYVERKIRLPNENFSHIYVIRFN